MGLQALLQKRAQLVAEQESLIANNEKGITEDTEKRFNEIQDEIKGLNAKIEMYRVVEDNKKSGVTATGQSVTGEGPTIILNPVKDTEKDNCGFASLGEFLHAVKYGDKKGRLEHAKSQNTYEGEDGGYMIPAAFNDELLAVTARQSVVRRYATVIPAGDRPDAPIDMPALDYSQGPDGGVRADWVGEGEEKPETFAKFRNVELKPQEVAAWIPVNDTLLRNAPAASGMFSQLLVNAISRAEDRAFTYGNGVKKPLGYAHPDNLGRLVVKREQAGKITTIDIAEMLANFAADDLPNAIFMGSSTILRSLITLKDEAGNYIFIRGDLTKGVPDSLMGIPLFLDGMSAPLGQEGDLKLVDLKKYLIKDGAGIMVSMSEHVRFTRNQTVIKAFRTVDAKPWVVAPYILEGGAVQASPYVILGGTNAASTPVTGLTATASGNSVTLKWTAANGAKTVNVLRSADGVAFERVNVNALDPAAAQYVDTVTVPGNYTYKLAVVGGANAGISNAANVAVSGAAAAAEE